MQKPAVVDVAPRPPERPSLAEMPSVLEGQITELCHDVALEVKRMRRLEIQADELRLALQEWVGHSEPHVTPDAVPHGDTHVTHLTAPLLPGINAQTPGTRPRAEDDVTTRAKSPDFHDRPGSGKHTADRLKWF